jgi:hypothetical protein
MLIFQIRKGKRKNKRRRGERKVRVCLDRAKNSVIIEKLRIISEDNKKIVIFRLA